MNRPKEYWLGYKGKNALVFTFIPRPQDPPKLGVLPLPKGAVDYVDEVDLRISAQLRKLGYGEVSRIGEDLIISNLPSNRGVAKKIVDVLRALGYTRREKKIPPAQLRKLNTMMPSQQGKAFAPSQHAEKAKFDEQQAERAAKAALEVAAKDKEK